MGTQQSIHTLTAEDLVVGVPSSKQHFILITFQWSERFNSPSFINEANKKVWKT